MPIPTLFDITLPALKIFADGKEYSSRDLTDLLSKEFNLTEEEMSKKLSSGIGIFHNRVNWATVELRMAQLITYSRKKYSVITEAGKKVLRNLPDRITRKYLMNFPAYREKVLKEKDNSNLNDDITGDFENTKTPEELIDIGYYKLRKELEDLLINNIKACSSSFFEKLVIDVLINMGYGGKNADYGEVIGKVGDEGIDGIIKEDPLGLDLIYIQAKKWESTVSRPEIQKFVGALQGKKAKKGVFITTSNFSKEAIEYSKTVDAKIVLIDGNYLTGLMIDYGIGVSVKKKIEINKIDSDYFTEE